MMEADPRDQPDDPERAGADADADADAKPAPEHDRWPPRVGALVATALMIVPFYLPGAAGSVMALVYLAGTVATVVLGVLARRHARARFHPGDVFYVLWATLLTIYGVGLLLMLWIFRGGWHS